MTYTKTQYNAWRRKRHARDKEIVARLKESTPCTDCKGFFPHYVMEFDHIPERGKKLKSISTLVATRSLEAPTMVAELAKCDLVCANCHKIRTHIRQQNI